MIGDQHDLFAFKHLYGADQLAVTLVADHGDNALTTTPALREIGHGGALTVTTRRRGEDLRISFWNQHRNNVLTFWQAHTAYAASGTTHGAHFALTEANHFAAIGEHHHFTSAVSHSSSDQCVAFVQLQRDQADTAWTAELHQRSFLHGAVSGGHEDISAGRFFFAVSSISAFAIFAVVVSRLFNVILLDQYAFDIVSFIAFRRLQTQGFQIDLQHRGDALAFAQRQQVNQWTSTGSARGFRNFIGLQPVNLTFAGEQQECGVAVGDQ